MNKIKKTFQFLAELAQQPSLINLILDRNENWKKKFADKYGDSEFLPQIQLSDITNSDVLEVPNFTFLGGGSLPTDLALLRSLCQQIPNCAYFEIGTWRGESAINVVDVTSSCYTLNLSDKELADLGYEKDYIDAHAVLSKDNQHITHLQGDSKKFDFAGLNKQFDVIFIDGNHHYDHVLSDTKKVFEHLMHENSIVVWHDYAYSPEDVRFEVYKAILDGIDKEKHHHIYHVANTMCAIYTNKPFKSNALKVPVIPEKAFNVVISTKQLNTKTEI